MANKREKRWDFWKLGARNEEGEGGIVFMSNNLASSSSSLLLLPTVVSRSTSSITQLQISKASARQRSGRASSAWEVCYRLYTEDYLLNQMPEEGIPEMQRSNLVSTLKALGIDNILVSNGLHLRYIKQLSEHLKYFIHFRSEHDDAKLTNRIPSCRTSTDEIIATAAVLSILVKALNPFFIAMDAILNILLCSPFGSLPKEYRKNKMKQN
ncbi:unnamed protein product [Arabidopsis halleri]